MAHPYEPGPKQFVFNTGDADDRRVTVGDAQEAYEAFSEFFHSREADVYSIEDEPAGQSLALRTGDGVIVRTEGADEPRAEYLKPDRPNRLLTSTMLFFENGHAGLDHFGQWFSDLSDLDASPEARGAIRAAAFTTEAAAIGEVARIWSDSGIVDPTDRYYIFFDAYEADEDPAERAELLKLIEFLNLERVDPQAEGAGGEVWVRTDSRLDDVLEQWS